MELLALDLALVRDVLLPGLSLTPGRAMMARVVSADEGSGGTLAIAGYLLDAELPKELSAGTTLRLVVSDVDASRVLLSVSHEPGAETPTTPTTPIPLAAPIPLPGGGQLAVLEDEGEGEGEGEGGGRRAPGGQALGLQIELPALGTLELRFALDPASVRATIAADPGEPLTQARALAGELQSALARAAQRTATVTITARREPVDVYA